MKKSLHVALGLVLEHCDGAMWILITRRHADSVLGGFWEFPGGKIEPGETPHVCAVRELAEEVGIAVQVTGELDAVAYTYDHAHVHLHPLLCRRIDGQPRALAVSDCRWVPAAQLSAYRFPPANAPLLAQLRERLQSGAIRPL